MRVIVTGHKGYIGLYTSAWLTFQGHEVLGVDLPEIDILDVEALKKFFISAKADAVIHLAALTSVTESFLLPGKYQEVNVRGTLNVFSAMASAGIHKLVFASSCSVVKQVSPYALSKAMCEDLIFSMAPAYGIDASILRYFNVAGGFIYPDSSYCLRVIPLLINATRPFIIRGNTFNTPDGTSIRDYVHVKDVARANELALSPANRGVNCCDIGTGIGTSMLELVYRVAKCSGRTINISFSQDEGKEDAIAVASPNTWLPWKPKYDLDQMIKEGLPK
jgi:UDP-glucose 4-epimerase